MTPPASIRWLCAALLITGPGLWAQDIQKIEGERVAILADKRINESSGLALGLRDPSIFWTLNDSGGEPCIFAIDHLGKTRAKVRLPEAANFDWEDLAAYRAPDGRPWLFVGDIGDNFRARPSIQIYQIPEPALPPPEKATKEFESEKPLLWHALYPDGPRNAESLLVHPKTGRIYIITKSEDGRSEVFVFPVDLVKGKALTLEKIATLEFPPMTRIGKRPRDSSLVTAACFSPDASHLVIATYDNFHEWTLKPGEPLGEALARPASAIIQAPALPQLEGVCYDPDGRTLWCTSERLPTPLYRIPRHD